MSNAGTWKGRKWPEINFERTTGFFRGHTQMLLLANTNHAQHSRAATPCTSFSFLIPHRQIRTDYFFSSGQAAALP